MTADATSGIIFSLLPVNALILSLSLYTMEHVRIQFLSFYAIYSMIQGISCNISFQGRFRPNNVCIQCHCPLVLIDVGIVFLVLFSIIFTYGFVHFNWSFFLLFEILLISI